MSDKRDKRNKRKKELKKITEKTMVPIYVISNGEIFREVLNAIVTIVGTGTFNTALRLSVAFSIIGATAHYIFKSSDPSVFL